MQAWTRYSILRPLSSEGKHQWGPGFRPTPGRWSFEQKRQFLATLGGVLPLLQSAWGSYAGRSGSNELTLQDAVDILNGCGVYHFVCIPVGSPSRAQLYMLHSQIPYQVRPQTSWKHPPEKGERVRCCRTVGWWGGQHCRAQHRSLCKERLTAGRANWAVRQAQCVRGCSLRMVVGCAPCMGCALMPSQELR